MPAGITIGIKGSTIEVAPKEGKRTPLRLETVTPDERRRLVLCDASGMAVEPAALWLSEVGLPVAPNSWEVVFARASRRCQNAGLAFDVSPHQLRHTAGTALRQTHGLEAAQVILGHKTLTVTQVYAERNVAAAREVMRKVG